MHDEVCIEVEKLALFGESVLLDCLRHIITFLVFGRGIAVDEDFRISFFLFAYFCAELDEVFVGRLSGQFKKGKVIVFSFEMILGLVGVLGRDPKGLDLVLDLEGSVLSGEEEYIGEVALFFLVVDDVSAGQHQIAGYEYA